MTKECPKCKSIALGLMSSLRIKICSECGTVIPWELDKGQKAIHTKEIGE